MINAGLGEYQMNSFLASVNLPTLSQRHLKKQEREVGLEIETLATKTCDEALQKGSDL